MEETRRYVTVVDKKPKEECLFEKHNIVRTVVDSKMSFEDHFKKHLNDLRDKMGTNDLFLYDWDEESKCFTSYVVFPNDELD